MNPVKRIYLLKREVLELHQATVPLVEPVEHLINKHYGFVPDELTEYFRDVSDHSAASWSRSRRSVTS